MLNRKVKSWRLCYAWLACALLNGVAIPVAAQSITPSLGKLSDATTTEVEYVAPVINLAFAPLDGPVIAPYAAPIPDPLAGLNFEPLIATTTEDRGTDISIGLADDMIALSESEELALLIGPLGPIELVMGGGITVESWVVIPEFAMNAGAPCAEQPTNSMQALAMVPLGQMPARPGISSALSGSMCFGSEWKLGSNATGTRDSLVALTFSPGSGLCEDGTCETRRFRSRIQVGIDDLTSSEGIAQGWYLFAGADDKAVQWRPNGQSSRQDAGGIALNDSVTIGDIEAGISLKRDRAELSMSYIHRETSYRLNEQEKLKDSDDFVGVVLRVK